MTLIASSRLGIRAHVGQSTCGQLYACCGAMCMSQLASTGSLMAFEGSMVLQLLSDAGMPRKHACMGCTEMSAGNVTLFARIRMQCTATVHAASDAGRDLFCTSESLLVLIYAECHAAFVIFQPAVWLRCRVREICHFASDQGRSALHV